MGSLEVGLRALREVKAFLASHSLKCEGYLQLPGMALERVKVSPKVDLLLLAPTDEGVNVGLRDEVLCLSLDSHMVRMSFFSFIRSASVALKSSNESRHRTSLHNP